VYMFVNIHDEAVAEHCKSDSHAVMMIMICMNEMLTGEDNDVQLSSRKNLQACCNVSL